jgi:hypothetical protein
MPDVTMHPACSAMHAPACRDHTMRPVSSGRLSAVVTMLRRRQLHHAPPPCARTVGRHTLHHGLPRDHAPAMLRLALPRYRSASARYRRVTAPGSARYRRPWSRGQRCGHGAAGISIPGQWFKGGYGKRLRPKGVPDRTLAHSRNFFRSPESKTDLPGFFSIESVFVDVEARRCSSYPFGERKGVFPCCAGFCRPSSSVQIRAKPKSEVPFPS